MLFDALYGGCYHSDGQNQQLAPLGCDASEILNTAGRQNSEEETDATIKSLSFFFAT